ncbi:hypothetical protein IQ17_03579 [Bradyrhizobium daqingense]|uniref:Uncharacterized protein n=1 Tax=Bradyrhizobium daqingense TaxID=993502 RepID=A0A562L9N7_9BRAD|nr:hypothetical protein IQ17_03579 [Bradyrhizobium daqingense]
MIAVMAGLVPAIHGLSGSENVEARDKPGHDEPYALTPSVTGIH